jgi:hypothetical protein
MNSLLLIFGGIALLVLIYLLIRFINSRRYENDFESRLNSTKSWFDKCCEKLKSGFKI